MSHNEIKTDLLIFKSCFEGIVFNGYAKKFKKEPFICQTNGVISDSIVQNWTLQALECYKIHCNCALCPITKAKYSFKCQMMHVVEILLKTKGLPNEREILSAYKSQQQNNRFDVA